jgi:hypothetical protein
MAGVPGPLSYHGGAVAGAACKASPSAGFASFLPARRCPHLILAPPPGFRRVHQHEARDPVKCRRLSPCPRLVTVEGGWPAPSGPHQGANTRTGLSSRQTCMGVLGITHARKNAPGVAGGFTSRADALCDCEQLVPMETKGLTASLDPPTTNTESCPKVPPAFPRNLGFLTYIQKQRI